MLTAAPLATAPRKKQQRRIGPCNDCSNLRVIQATVGVDKQKKNQSILLTTQEATPAVRSRKILA